MSERGAHELRDVLPHVADEVHQATRRRPKAERAAIAADVVVNARRALLGGPADPSGADPPPLPDVAEPDSLRLVAGVQAWAARNGVAFGVAVDRVLARLTTVSPAPAARIARPSECLHPINRRIGLFCAACQATVK